MGLTSGEGVAELPSDSGSGRPTPPPPPPPRPPPRPRPPRPPPRGGGGGADLGGGGARPPPRPGGRAAPPPPPPPALGPLILTPQPEPLPSAHLRLRPAWDLGPRLSGTRRAGSQDRLPRAHPAPGPPRADLRVGGLWGPFWSPSASSA